ncbi:MAG: sulfatase-like hydrolase/transferase [Rhodospirillales bacterium]
MPPNDRPNVLLLSADTFRADRLGLYGYGRPTSPNLDRFAADSIVCDNAYTLGPFTQLACIQLFTSSRPLSYGGYDRGAAGRPDTVFKHFRDAGYRTWGLSTIHWVSPYYGYTDGLDTEISVFHLNTLIGMAVMNMRDTIRLFDEGRIAEADMLATVKPVITRLFENVEHYAATYEARIGFNRQHFPNAKFVADGYAFSCVRRVVDRHRDAFAHDATGYIARYLLETPEAHEWLAQDWRLCRRPGKLLHEAWLRLTNKAVGAFSPELAGKRANRVRYAVDADTIATQVTRELNSHGRDDEQPFFIWAHFKDNHQPYVSGHGRDWVGQAQSYLSQLGYPADIDPTMVFRANPQSADEFARLQALYDASMLSVDTAIGRILDTLDARGLADNTIVAVCGDHGEEIGEHGDFGHLCMQYEHNARIPMMFRVPGESDRRTASMVTSMDLAPTLAAYAGLDQAVGWEGAPVTDDAVAARGHVLMENFCRGNCEFAHRPIYMAVRAGSHKYLWREWVDPHHKMGTPEPMLFDLDADPEETRNIFRPEHPEVEAMQRVIYERLEEIPEVSEERARAALKTERS